MSKILYPSCSELVTRLELFEIDEMKDALKRICDVTGYKIGFTKGEYKLSTTPLDGKGMHKQEYKFHEVDIKDLVLDKDHGIGILKDTVSDYITKNYAGYYSNEPIVSVNLVHPTDPSLSLDIMIGDPCSGGDDLCFECSDCDVNKFPMLKEIMNIFKSEVSGVDGGHTGGFEDWLNGEDNVDEE